MNHLDHKPCFQSLSRIEAKLDAIEAKINTNNHKNITQATVAGGGAGVVMGLGIALLKAKLGLGG